MSVFPEYDMKLLQYWVTCDAYLVERSKGLVRRVPWDVIPQSDGRQGYEAVVERVWVTPPRFDSSEYEGRNYEEQQKWYQENYEKMRDA